MIRHVALFRFSNGMPEKILDALLQRFCNLKGTVAGLLSVHVGTNCSPEALDKGFRHGIIMDFESIGDLKQYLSHPLHVPIAEDLIKCLATGLADDIVVFDLEIG
tara:strand:+ start:3780 stop:4094 length:315 start_codon:yes stop_codon:yes gene_type:complete